MKTITAFTKRHPVLTYFALTFVISWTGLLLVAGPSGISATSGPSETLLPFMYLGMLAGPSLAGVLLTGLVSGQAGFREVRSRLFRWQVGARWYALALLTAPLVWMATLFALSLTSRAYLPDIVASDDKASLLLFGITVGLVVGMFEELGWTGFAIPRLRQRYGVLTTGLIVGVLWGAWHFPLFFWGSGTFSGGLPPALVLFVQLFSFLPAFRVLMVWVYDRTESLLVAMLMHASQVVCTLSLAPLAIAGIPLVTSDLVFAAVLWVVVAVAAVASRGQFSRQALPRGVA
ncbi:MAG TPA: type II CAAX endopeptidase family protein [Roseiflexaceae bacterium]|nr:type II CAAX endopeptidase family protein [Roseiflexaceae bacterium]